MKKVKKLALSPGADTSSYATGNSPIWLIAEHHQLAYLLLINLLNSHEAVLPCI